MCRIMEEVAREAFREGFEDGYRERVERTAQRMRESGVYTSEEIAKVSELSLDEMEEELQKALESSERPWNWDR